MPGRTSSSGVLAGSGTPYAPSPERSSLLHQAWRIAVAVTIVTGILHLLNLVAPGRLQAGTLLLTPFRLSFFIAWVLLLAAYATEGRLPRFDRADLLVAAIAAVFIIRGAFTPGTLGTTINWLITGAGVFFLVKHGVRSARDVKIVLAAVVGAVLVVCVYGLLEYAFKSNPLFDSIQIDAIGMDKRVAADEQLYRIRSLIGHPGYVGAILLGAVPPTILLLWRRRTLMFAALLALGLSLFLTFSRGSWLIAVLVLLPVLAFRARRWFVRNLKWVAPTALILLSVMAVDYWGRDDLWAELGRPIRDDGLHWTKSKDGPVVLMSGEAYGLQPYNKFIYFNVDDGFYYGASGPVTVTVHYFDKGYGAIRVDYDGADPDQGEEGGIFTPTASVNKTNTLRWTSSAFYLEQPRFENRQNGSADFRVVDDDSIFTVDRVEITKGKLKLPSVVAQQWLSRSSSLGARASLYPFAWDVLAANPLGVGLYSTPGTENHAVDSLPLTWMMEFGWLGLILIGGLLAVFAYEGVRVWRDPRGPAAVLMLSLVIILLHGGHLMILYDKPTLVMTATLAAVYAAIRPWRRGGPQVSASNESCML